ncbi:hypothetical protein Afil01_32750 [Actinorhabdospora filicis]|uniref:Uncharacterized protein n=1 Tax=Actinorhabdospora filicis TaxID=1785913 RepID=A0A9W6SLJ4_9ACTN|nr:hypothetical protein [Actinorhabdospora filicis]GLZ78468.1 hypothetical protein Afil01_32750 [Actinorhabdospora filicis]
MSTPLTDGLGPLAQPPAGEPLDVLVLTTALRSGEQIVIHGVLADRHLDRDQVLRAATAAGLDLDRVRREWTGWLADRGAGVKRQGVLRAARLLGVAESTAMDAWQLSQRPAGAGEEN